MDLAQIRNASAQAERLLFEHSFSGEIVLKIKTSCPSNRTKGSINPVDCFHDTYERGEILKKNKNAREVSSTGTLL